MKSLWPLVLLLLVSCSEQEPTPVTTPTSEPLVRAAPIPSQVPPAALKYRSVLTREAHFVAGLTAPIPMYAAQIEQESGWRPGITSWDEGRGLAQVMDATGEWLAELFPELGTPQPYDPLWAIRAMVRYDAWLTARVKGIDACHRAAAALKGYNSGIGRSQKAQKVSLHPGIWFGVTEWINTGQSTKNFESSRMYPRWVLLKRQPKYRNWGAYMCDGMVG